MACSVHKGLTGPLCAPAHGRSVRTDAIVPPSDEQPADLSQPLARLTAPMYLLVRIGDDPLETDGRSLSAVRYRSFSLSARLISQRQMMIRKIFKIPIHNNAKRLFENRLYRSSRSLTSALSPRLTQSAKRTQLAAPLYSADNPAGYRIRGTTSIDHPSLIRRTNLGLSHPARRRTPTPESPPGQTNPSKAPARPRRSAIALSRLTRSLVLPYRQFLVLHLMLVPFVSRIPATPLKFHSIALMPIEALPREIEVDCAEHGFEKAAIFGQADVAAEHRVECMRPPFYRAIISDGGRP